MRRRVPEFWKEQKLDFAEACKIVENTYKQLMIIKYGNRMTWIKLMNCNESKKRKMYWTAIYDFLKHFVAYFDFVFDKIVFQNVVLDVIKEIIEWYKDYFVFTHLGSVKVFEIFDKKIINRFGSVNIYLDIKNKKAVRNLNQIEFNISNKIDLKELEGGIYTF